MATDHDVVQDGHAPKEPHRLKSDSHPQPSAAIGRQRGNVPTLQVYRPFVGTQVPGDEMEQASTCQPHSAR